MGIERPSRSKKKKKRNTSTYVLNHALAEFLFPVNVLEGVLQGLALEQLGAKHLGELGPCHHLLVDERLEQLPVRECE